MNIKYNFNEYEKISLPLTSPDIFKESGTTNGGLYPWNYEGNTPNQIFGKNIELINDRINKIGKQLAYWDLYKLTSQVKSPTDLDSTFAALIPGQALVINCSSFRNNNQDYHRGDVVVKMLDGEAAYIPAISTGVFYPSELIRENANYRLHFEFMTTVPDDKKIQDLELEPSDSEKSFVYGIYEPIDESPYVFRCYLRTEESAGTSIERPIKPLIKFFTADNEEIDIHFKATLTGVSEGSYANAEWSVEWDTNAPIGYIQVK